jgi:hypothetical protein
MFRKRSVARMILIASGCLAVTAPAAQARPIDLVPGSQAGTWKSAPTAIASRPVLTEPIQLAAPNSSSGFNWTDGAAGAAFAAALLGLARITTARVRPRHTATS